MLRLLRKHVCLSICRYISVLSCRTVARPTRFVTVFSLERAATQVGRPSISEMSCSYSMAIAGKWVFILCRPYCKAPIFYECVIVQACFWHFMQLAGERSIKNAYCATGVTHFSRLHRKSEYQRIFNYYTIPLIIYSAHTTLLHEVRFLL